uniref:Penton n=1 Tax=Adenoviridae sp. TaxID=2558248 RepID=A0A7D5Q2F7_9ADEN|nr:MAG: penton [Adenoviridae sp.]
MQTNPQGRPTPGPYPLTFQGMPTYAAAQGSAEPSAELYLPPQRVMAPTGGRNSIKYKNLQPQQNTTSLYYVDNKVSDLDTYNQAANHSNFRTTIIHNQDLDPETAGTECIQLDNRSCWGGELKAHLKTNCPNVTEFFQSDTVRVRLMASRDPSGGEDEQAGKGFYNPKGAVYKWYDLKIPEGNYGISELIDILNEGIVQLYLSEGRQNNVLRSDIGVKFDTRHFGLLRDPVTGLVTAGKYVYKGYHPDVILLPGCAIDFTFSRLNLMLGITKREPYSKGFIITYEDLEGGDIPPLLDVDSLNLEGTDEIIKLQDAKPLLKDPQGISYNVVTSRNKPPVLAYRSWMLAYQCRENKCYKQFLLTVPDMCGGLGALYWSMPDTFQPPSGFKDDNTTNQAPVVGMQLFPAVSKSVYLPASAYSQRLENSVSSATAAFNRFPENEILKQAPPINVCSINDNQPTVIHQAALPLRNTLPGLQRVLVTDDQRRPCPYIQKTLASVNPRVLSSATLQ